MIQVFPFNYQHNLIAAHAHEIRRKVFVIEQNVQPDMEFDDHETRCQHYLAYHDNRAVGTARWRETEEGIKLERFAVLPQYRNKGIGTILLKHLIEDVKFHFKPIYVTAQLHMCPWFEKNGFEITGDEFIEVGIPHRKLIFPGWPAV
ncbi:MAG: GNAT family N-acetyltransferase [Bacteroidia bacterium]|nr:GNAT family N-acetyltransferase [Bacteroidia bacterium]MCZ2277806.1 GNAT family N-acetyltransferase [Bacteroidia bacterium]